MYIDSAEFQSIIERVRKMIPIKKSFGVKTIRNGCVISRNSRNDVRLMRDVRFGHILTAGIDCEF